MLGPAFKGNKAFKEVKEKIAQLTTLELEKLREVGTMDILNNTIKTSDLLISEKFLEDNVNKEYEEIGGEKVMYFSIYLVCYSISVKTKN